MNTHTTDLRNRVYPATDEERAAYAQTRDALPRIGGGLYWGEPDPATVREGERLRRETRYAGERPASARETAAIVGVCICGVLLLAGLAYLVYLGTHGAPWTR